MKKEYNQKTTKKGNQQLRSKGADTNVAEEDNSAAAKMQKSVKLAQDLKKFNDDLQKMVNQVTQEDK